MSNDNQIFLPTEQSEKKTDNPQKLKSTHKEDRKKLRLQILKWSLIIVFAIWVTTEYVIFLQPFGNIESLKLFSKQLPFFLTTILGVIIGTSID